jgi:5'-nucleotidase
MDRTVRSAPVLLALLMICAPPHAQAADWPTRVLIVNDDGIESPATQALARAFGRISETVLVAPNEDWSGSSNYMASFTQRQYKVEARAIGPGVEAWALEGSPADCVLFALLGPMGESPPDLVVSGVNSGPNDADAWFWSGTLGAARTATFFGRVPAIAVSGVANDDPESVAGVVEWVVKLAQSEVVRELRAPAYLSVDLPVGPPEEIRGIAFADRARGHWRDSGRLTGSATQDSLDPSIWSIVLGIDPQSPPEGSDVAALRNGYIVVTPMRVGDDDLEAREWLSDNKDLFPAW